MSRPSSRKGLRRIGMRRYALGRWIIERDRPWRWFVYPDGHPAGRDASFFSMKFKRLYEARAYAEGRMGK